VDCCRRAGVSPVVPSSIRGRGSITVGLATGWEFRQPVQSAKANVPPRWHSLPILPVACRAQRSCLANEWPTNDQWHDRRTWRSCHLPGTSLSGWPDLNRRPLRPEYSQLILPHSQHQDEETDAETIRGVREHAGHRLCLAVLLTGLAPQRSARSCVHSDPRHGILKYRRQPVRGAQGRLVTANLNDKPVTNDQGPNRCEQRSGP
jgi:hypothetical protein